MAENSNFFREDAIKDTFFTASVDGKAQKLMTIQEIN